MQACRKATETAPRLAPASLWASAADLPRPGVQGQAIRGRGSRETGAYQNPAQPTTIVMSTDYRITAKALPELPRIMTSSLSELSWVESLIGRPEDDIRDLRSRDASCADPIRSTVESIRSCQSTRLILYLFFRNTNLHFMTIGTKILQDLPLSRPGSQGSRTPSPFLLQRSGQGQ